MLDTNGDTGSVDLLNGELRIYGTNRQIVSNVSGNTFTLKLANDLSVNEVDINGNLDVIKATSLHSTLQVQNAVSMK